MKKLIVFAAAAALLLTGCAKQFEVSKSDDFAAPIGFSTFSENMTKARTEGSDTFVSGDAFTVYGVKTVNSTASTVFDGVSVSYDGSAWTYTPLKFWDKAASEYDFFAYSNSSAVTYTASTNTGLFSGASITFAGNNGDVLVANKTAVTTIPAANAKVEMVFNHIASKVDVAVKKSTALSSAEVILTKLEIAGAKNAASYAVSGYDSSTNVPAVTWTPSGSAAYSNTSGVTSKALTTAVATTAANYIESLIVAPQAFTSDLKVNIEYTINGDPISRSFNLSDFDIVDDTDNDDTKVDAAWAQGKYYVYTITINANAIEFTASINPWTNATPGFYYIAE